MGLGSSGPWVPDVDNQCEILQPPADQLAVAGSEAGVQQNNQVDDAVVVLGSYQYGSSGGSGTTSSSRATANAANSLSVVSATPTGHVRESVASNPVSTPHVGHALNCECGERDSRRTCQRECCF